MKFYSTNNHELSVSFETALLTGMPADYGLYMMSRNEIPVFTRAEIESLSGKSYAEIAYAILFPYLSEDFEVSELRTLLNEAYSPQVMPVPIQKVSDVTSILWLTQGPTCSFKDFAARFFGKSLNHFLKKRSKKRLVVVATSGDTGGAIADALHKLDSVFCVVLYPDQGVSDVQRRQMTTLEDNVYAVAVPGDFDVCQALAKRLLNDSAFARNTFEDEEFVTSANSISLGRLLPQIVFPFYAYAHIGREQHEPFAVSVPSGNFGDMMGTVLAKHMGLPITKIICGVNENKTFSDFLFTGEYQVRPAVYSPSSAMIVSHPSNVARLIDLYEGHLFDERDAETQKVIHAGVLDVQPDMEALRKDIFSCSISNALHGSVIQSFHAEHTIIIEPHGAVGVEALRVYREQTGDETRAVIYETADPAKFPDDVKKALGITPEQPPQITTQGNLPERIYRLMQQAITSPALGKTASDEQYAELCGLIADLNLLR